MNDRDMEGPYPYRVALIGNYLPRRCGIATFTADLTEALGLERSESDYWVVAMNDRAEGYDYPMQVRFEVSERSPADYALAADFLNMNRVEVACLQHEYGIYGGEHGAYVLDLVSNLRMPLVTTLHTVVQEPTPKLAAVTRRIAELSDRVVVMSDKAASILKDVYGIPSRVIEKIPHGIPDVPFVDPAYYKDQYGVEGRKVILTFGLLSPNKGIETMIEALPSVVATHPDAVYVVLGATHPHVRRQHGEAYRLSLQRLARQVGVEDHVIFHDRFVSQRELLQFLGAADLYVTPYLHREQAASGTLAYALGSGKAAISTPYWYAEELLAEGRGRLVPFRDAEALAEETIDLLTNEVERHAVRKRAYRYTRDMVWKEVARRYLEVFANVKRQRQTMPRPVFQTKTLAASPRVMPTPNLEHIVRLTDDVGILQHATHIVPNRDHGYCTDDNARALLAVIGAESTESDGSRLTDLAATYLAFLHHAFDPDRGRFRNFMAFDRRWLEAVGSEDSHARALWSLGRTVATATSQELRAVAQTLFEAALPAVTEFTSPRAWAFSLFGINAYLERYRGDSEARRIRQHLAEALLERHRKHAVADWPWIEDTLTYANGRIPHALIAAGSDTGDPSMTEAGLASLEWLVRVQTDPRGHFAPVGSNGWYPRGGQKARFDQQPIEALAMIQACGAAYDATGDAIWISRAQVCADWFLGRNDLNLSLYDPKSGGCRDGLNADGVNSNQGAESTLACFLSFLELNRTRSRRIAEIPGAEA